MSNPTETAQAAANYQLLLERMTTRPFQAAVDLQNMQFTGMRTKVCDVPCTLYSSGSITVPGDMEAHSDSVYHLRNAVFNRAAILRARYDEARKLLADVPGGATEGRVAKLMEVLELHEAKVFVVSDERTGRRYGEAKCRNGKAKKLGGGGRNKGSRFAYQVWADWSK